MVDIISTRFQGMYDSWNYFNSNTAGNMDRSGKEKKQDRDERLYKDEIQVSFLMFSLQELFFKNNLLLFF